MWVCPPVCVSHCSLFFFHWPPCHFLYSTSFYLHERCEFPRRPGLVSMVTAGHESVSCSVSSTEGEEMWPDVHVLIPSLPVWGDAAVWPSDQCLSDRRGTRERCNLWVTVSNRGIDEAESLSLSPTDAQEATPFVRFSGSLHTDLLYFVCLQPSPKTWSLKATDCTRDRVLTCKIGRLQEKCCIWSFCSNWCFAPSTFGGNKVAATVEPTPGCCH